MKKAITLLIAMYLYLMLPFAVFLQSSKNDTSSALLYITLGVCFLLILIVSIFNLRSATELLRDRNYDKLRSEMEILKLGSIPFFVAEYVILACMGALFSLLAIFFIWTIGGPLAFILLFTLCAFVLYTILLISSIYGIAFVRLLQREGVINTGLMAVYIVLQLIPIADVVATFVLLSKYKKRIVSN